ncbi:MAG: glutaredoxin 3 [Hyphomicrobiales bacterium]|nr:glutaredoxin 3 [Hyphomicrobiales bacterium]
MQPVEIYTKATCPYCIRAKRLLDRKSVAYSEISVDGDMAGQMKMAERSGGRSTVPQIFIGGRHIGGCDDLHDLDYDGKLDALLAG